MNERLCATLLTRLADLRERVTAAKEALADLVLGPTEGPGAPGSGRPPKDHEEMVKILQTVLKQKIATLLIQYYVAKKQFLAAGCNPGNRLWVMTSHRVVQVNEPFHVTVLASSASGVESLFWAGVDTKQGELNEDHVHLASGEKLVEHTWGPFKAMKPGHFVFAARMSDTAFGEFQIIARCALGIRDDVSYDAQVQWVKTHYGRSEKWRAWMLSPDIRNRYEWVWKTSRLFPTTVKLDYHYGGDAPVYDPAWQGGEQQHMDQLGDLGNFVFSGAGVDSTRGQAPLRNLQFALLYGAEPSFGDVHVKVTGDAPKVEYDPATRTLTLIREQLLGHEFGHALIVDHHYTEDAPNTPIFMPPAEPDATGQLIAPTCVMAKTGVGYCSGCRAAMHLDVNIDNALTIELIMKDFEKRYAPTYGSGGSK